MSTPKDVQKRRLKYETCLHYMLIMTFGNTLSLPFGCRFPASPDAFGPDKPFCSLLGLPVMDSSNVAPSFPVWPISSGAGLLFSASSTMSSSCLIVSSVKQNMWLSWHAHFTVSMLIYHMTLLNSNCELCLFTDWPCIAWLCLYIGFNWFVLLSNGWNLPKLKWLVKAGGVKILEVTWNIKASDDLCWLHRKQNKPGLQKKEIKDLQ